MSKDIVKESGHSGNIKLDRTDINKEQIEESQKKAVGEFSAAEKIIKGETEKSSEKTHTAPIFKDFSKRVKYDEATNGNTQNAGGNTDMVHSADNSGIFKNNDVSSAVKSDNISGTVKSDSSYFPSKKAIGGEKINLSRDTKNEAAFKYSENVGQGIINEKSNSGIIREKNSENAFKFSDSSNINDTSKSDKAVKDTDGKRKLYKDSIKENLSKKKNNDNPHNTIRYSPEKNDNIRFDNQTNHQSYRENTESNNSRYAFTVSSDAGRRIVKEKQAEELIKDTSKSDIIRFKDNDVSESLRKPTQTSEQTSDNARDVYKKAVKDKMNDYAEFVNEDKYRQTVRENPISETVKSEYSDLIRFEDENNNRDYGYYSDNTLSTEAAAMKYSDAFVGQKDKSIIIDKHSELASAVKPKKNAVKGHIKTGKKDGIIKYGASSAVSAVKEGLTETAKKSGDADTAGAVTGVAAVKTVYDIVKTDKVVKGEKRRLVYDRSKTANTSLLYGIIFLQKRENLRDFEKDGMPEWVNVSEIDKSLYTDKALENGSKIFINDYFKSNPEMVAGELKVVSTQFGFDTTCTQGDKELTSMLDAAVSNIHGNFTAEVSADKETSESKGKNADIIAEKYRNFCYHVIDNDIYYRENDDMVKQNFKGAKAERVKGMIQISNVLQELIKYQRDNYPDERIEAKQNELNTVYDAFTKKYGLLNNDTNHGLFKGDDTSPLIASLENIDEKGNLKNKADIFTKRTIKAYVPVTSVKNSDEALTVSISEKAKIDLDFMSELSSKSKDEIIEDLKGIIFKNPETGEYENSDEYLSGNVREKLRIATDYAKTDSSYAVNVEHLKAVQPVDLKPEEIEAQLGSTWIPTKYFQQFMYELLETPKRCHSDNLIYNTKNPFESGRNANNTTIEISFDEHSATYGISNKNSFSADRENIKAMQTYGTSRKNAYTIIEDALNMKPEKIYDYIEGADGKPKAVLNPKETVLAQEKQDEIKQRFKEWIFSDYDRTKDLCKIYNEKFNSTRPREYNGSRITFVGMNPQITLRPHQVNAIAHTLYGGNTLLAHSVGAGKTFEMVASAMESKRLGLCNKSLICVPKHILNQVAREFLQLYPAANILVPDEKDFSKENRQKFCSRIATGNYDAIILSHNQFEKIPLSEQRQAEYIQNQVNSIVDELEKLKRNSAGKGFSIKQLEATKKNLDAKLKKLNNNEKRDSTICFEDLGVDKIYVDEAHLYKNKFFSTKIGTNVAGINASKGAQRSTDLDMKCRYIDEITGGKGLCFATGTPLSNSMSELYVMQSYLQRDELKKKGLDNFDAWASTFGEIKLTMELAPEGNGFQLKNRFAKFFNLPELITMFKEIADIKTPDVLKLPVPKANFHNIAVEASELQKEMVAELGVRADDIRHKRVSSSADNMLNITNDGRKLALDQRLMATEERPIPDFPDSKVNKCVENVFRIWNNTASERLTQMIFCDLSTPSTDGKFSVYNDIKEKLVKMGIPENEVAFIHDCKTDEQKQALFNKVQNGDVRVLLGSTQRMGTGTNCQRLLKAVHHIDCPYRPSDIEQRNGRIIRQGNQNAEVDIFNYVTKNTFDSYLYQLVENKQKFVAQIMTSKSPVRSAEDIDDSGLNYAQLKALASGNPKIERKMNLEVEVARLKTLFSAHQENERNLQFLINQKLPEDITRFEGLVNRCKEDMSQAAATKSEEFVGMTVGGKFYEEKKEAGEALLAALDKLSPTSTVNGKSLGEYRGFEIKASYSNYSNDFVFNIKNKGSYEISFGTDTYGNIKRLDNLIDNYIAERLPNYERNLEQAQNQLTAAKANIGKPFERQAEYEAKEKELRELNKEFANESFSKKEDKADETPQAKKKDEACI